MIALLHNWGYNVVDWATLNTNDHGIHQARSSFYLIAIRNQVCAFTFPPEIASLGFDAWLEEKHATPASKTKNLRMYSKSSIAKIDAGMLNLRAMGYDPTGRSGKPLHGVIDIAATPKLSTALVGCSPRLSSSRCMSGGHYITRFSRTMSMAEICWLQGIPWHGFDFVAANVGKAHSFMQLGAR